MNKIKELLKILGSAFDEKDEMLRYKGIIPLYYLFLKQNPNIDTLQFKSFLKNFDLARANNRKIGKAEKPNTTMLQFDRLNQQGAHQAKSLETRLKILNFYFSESKK